MERLATKLKLAINRYRISQLRNDNEVVMNSYRAEVKELYEAYADAHDKHLEDLSSDDLEAEFAKRDTMDRFYIESLKQDNDNSMQVEKDKTGEKTINENVKRDTNFTKIISRPANFAGQSDDFYLWHRHLITYTNHVQTTAEKLLILSEAVSGPAAETIRPFLTSDADDRFEAAVELLRSRFGNDLNVSESAIARLEGWPVMDGSNPTAVRSFADFLRTVLFTAQKVDGLLTILDSKLLNRRILNKLPCNIRVKWVEVTRERKDQFPSFQNFVEFVNRQADILNDPLLENSNLPQSAGLDTPVSCFSTIEDRRKDASRGSSGRSNQCYFCESQEHFIGACPKYKYTPLEKRKEFVRKSGLCTICLSKFHNSDSCHSRYRCNTCNQTHHTSLHDYATALAGCTEREIGKNVTTIVPVEVTHPKSNRTVTVYALLDSMCNTNFITKGVVDSLGIETCPVSLTINTMSGRTTSNSATASNIIIKGIGEKVAINLPDCYVKPNIPCDRSSIPDQGFISLHPHLSAIKVPPSASSAPVGLLLGYNTSAAFCPLEVSTNDIHSPFAVKTALGWTIMGPMKSDARPDAIIPKVSCCFNTSLIDVNSLSPSEEDEIFRAPAPLVILNHLPKYSEPKTYKASAFSYSQEDLKFLNLMDSQMTRQEDGHYVAPLPLKENAKLPKNLYVATQRLNSLKKKLSKDADLHSRYTASVEEMLAMDFAERCDPSKEPENAYYIPHHAVDQGKLRVVFDCSLKVQNTSLNDNLLQGPDLLNSLLGILLRFRERLVGLTCDIRKMFHNFRVPEKDRDYLRFLWWPEGDINSEPIPYRMCVHLFGAGSSPAVATYGLRRIVNDFKDSCSRVSNFVRNDFYVDDGLISVNTHDEAVQLFHKTKEVLSFGALKCHKVMSNSKEVMNLIDTDDRATLVGNRIKTLGIMWDVVLDTISVSTLVKTGIKSRRLLLAAVSQIYDPLGLAAPIILYGKNILQELARLGFDWDDKFTENLSVRVSEWCNLCNEISEISVPRFIDIYSSNFANSEIHIFCDASSVGYSACAYVRYKTEEDQYGLSFVMGKARVAPLSPALTIPMLELTAAVLATSLSIVIKRETIYKDSSFVFWSDSMIVMNYLKNGSTRYKVFVANRVSFVLAHSSPDQWRHIESALNPADCGSRGIWESTWIDGPSFLLENNDMPTEINVLPQPDYKVALFTQEEPPSVSETPIVSSSMTKTLRLMARVLRFINRLRNKQCPVHDEFSIEELNAAKIRLVRLLQISEFHAEIELLKENKTVRKDSRLYRLDVFLDKDGILRVGGRLKRSALDFNTSHPIVLSNKSRFANQILEHCHHCVHHQGRGLTISEVRNNGFWILGLTHCVKRLIRACFICARLRGKPIIQKMADLPEERSVESPPFTHCGCDVFGPFNLTGGLTVKRWILIFVCMFSRAVHLETLVSLSSDSFLCAFRRFSCIRGPVSSLHCDRGTNFTGAARTLINWGCSVKFNPALASHFGGFYERLIGSARRVIEGILVQNCHILNEESFSTLIAETTWTLNCRPLSVETLNDPLSPLPLTANLLLTQKPRNVLLDDLPELYPDENKYASKHWKRVRYLTDLFVTRWKGEIAQNLQTRNKWNSKNPGVEVNDIVLLIDANLPRLRWKIGRVSSTSMSNDGLIRSATIQLSDRSLTTRPVNKLVLLHKATSR